MVAASKQVARALNYFDICQQHTYTLIRMSRDIPSVPSRPSPSYWGEEVCSRAGAVDCVTSLPRITPDRRRPRAARVHIVLLYGLQLLETRRQGERREGSIAATAARGPSIRPQVAERVQNLFSALPAHAQTRASGPLLHRRRWGVIISGWLLKPDLLSHARRARGGADPPLAPRQAPQCRP